MTLEWLIPDRSLQGLTFYRLLDTCRTGKHPLTKSRLHSMGAAQCRYICIDKRRGAVPRKVRNKRTQKNEI